MDDFFYIFSKIVIVIPIVIIVVALFIKFNQKPDFFSQKKTPTPTPEIKKIPPTKTPNPIDLKGPYICQFQDKEASLSAYIFDKKVFVKKENKGKIENYLLNNDCFYFWEKGKFAGEKFCGLSGYFNLLNLLPNFSQFDILGAANLNLNNYFSHCKKQPIENKEIFNIPNNILFKNTSIEELLGILKSK